MKPVYTEVQWQHEVKRQQLHRRVQAWLLFFTGLGVGMGLTAFVRLIMLGW